MGSWHPLTWFSLMLDTQLWGTGPAGYHATGVLIHAINSALAFFLLHRLTGSLWRSGAAAVLWAIHPLRVESVTWISERKDVLCVMFGLLSLLAYERYVRESPYRRRRLGWNAATWVFMALSLASKPMTVTLPCVMLLLDAWPFGRFPRGGEDCRWRRCAALVIEKWPGWLMVTVFSVLTFLTQREMGAVASESLVSSTSRLAIALNGYITYLGMTFWPRNMAIFYPLMVPDESQLITAASILAIVTIIVVVVMKRSTLGAAAALGWFWYLGTIVPVIGFLQTGSQAVADRYTYLPTIGLYFAVVWIAACPLVWMRSKWPMSRLSRIAGAVLGCVAFCVIAGSLVLLTWRQIGRWQSPLTMWSHNLQITPHNPVAHAGLGPMLMQQGRWIEAEYHLATSVEQDPRDFHAHANLATVAMKMRRMDLAERHTALALAIDNSDPVLNRQMAQYLIQRGQRNYVEAIGHLRTAVAGRPDDADLRCSIAALLELVGRPAEAEIHWREALRINPAQPDALVHVGDGLLNNGRISEAIGCFRAALASRPSHLLARKKLAIALLGIKAFSEAASQIQAALSVDDHDPTMFLCLGIARMEMNDPDAALDAFRRATQLAPNNPAAFRYRAKAAAAMKLPDEAAQCEQTAVQLEAALRRPPG